MHNPLRVFYASDTSPNARFNSNIWRNNLLLPLKDLGYDVVEFDYDLQETFQNLDAADPRQAKFISQNRPIVSEELFRQIKAAHAIKPIQVFFSYFYDACVLPETIKQIRSLGIVTVNWYCNGSYQLHLVKQISPHYDWCLVPEKFRMPDYYALGARPIYCQEAANPNIYKPYQFKKDYDLIFIGQAYGDRIQYIKGLIDAGLCVNVWGFGWRPAISKLTTRSVLLSPARFLKQYVRLRQRKIPFKYLGGVLNDDEMIKMYSRAKINLGFSNVGNTHLLQNSIKQIRLRDFEVPMSAGFYMVEYMQELEQFFEIGKEIECYFNLEDLIDKSKYYLQHEVAREEIRLRGYQRCLRDHTWQKRLTQAFVEMGIIQNV